MKGITLQHRDTEYTENTENTGKVNVLFLVSSCLCGKQVVTK